MSAENTADFLRRFQVACDDELLEPAFVLLRGKMAFQKGWKELRPSLEEAIEHLERSPDHNVGIQPASLGCVVLDCDEGDGPEAAAEAAGEALVCVAPSSSGNPKKGHVWIRCTGAGSVGNGKFRVEDAIGSIAEGDLRSSGGQVMLTDGALAMLAERLPNGGHRWTPDDFRGIARSTSQVVDADFDPGAGMDVDEDRLPAELLERLKEPSLPERYRELHHIGCRFKQLGYSFNSTLDFISPFVQSWPSEDAKFEGAEMERHLAMVWRKAKTAGDDFADLEEGSDPGSGVVAGPSQEQAVGRQMTTSLTTGRENKAGDTISNAYEALKGSGLQPAFDELKQRVVFRADRLAWDESYGRELNENTLRLLRAFLVQMHAENRYEPSKENVHEATMTIAYQYKFNPVLDYLDGLKWDGVSRVESLFPRYFAVADDALSRAVSRCFMVAAVRRQRRPGCKVDTMPVLKGPQRVGKSSGLRELFGGDWFSDATLGDLNSKDAILGLQGIWAH